MHLLITPQPDTIHFVPTGNWSPVRQMVLMLTCSTVAALLSLIRAISLRTVSEKNTSYKKFYLICIVYTIGLLYEKHSSQSF